MELGRDILDGFIRTDVVDLVDEAAYRPLLRIGSEQGPRVG